MSQLSWSANYEETCITNDSATRRYRHWSNGHQCPTGQNKGPAAYFIADITEISNPTAFRQAVQKVGAVIVASGGHYLARSDNIVSLAGLPPKRFVIVSFENIDAAKAWADKAEALMSDVDNYSKQRRFLVNGNVD